MLPARPASGMKRPNRRACRRVVAPAREKLYGRARGGRSSMKVTIDIECTPAEARQFLGLPDVEPLQAAVMKEVERRMLAEMERFSPEGLLRSWLSVMPQNAERLQEMFTGLFTRGLGAGTGGGDDKGR
jgi:hypothetical protein